VALQYESEESVLSAAARALRENGNGITNESIAFWGNIMALHGVSASSESKIQKRSRHTESYGQVFPRGNYIRPLRA
jgi:hypothetical protein